MSSWISERAVSKSPLLHACRQAVVTDEAPGMINPPLLSGQTIPTPGHPALTLLGTSPPCLSARFGHSLVRDKPCVGQAWRGARGTRSTRNQEHESARALHRAIELGMNFIDTARGYGESEGIVGKIRFFGVSINDYQPDNALELVRSGHVDTIQAIDNVFHQAPRERLLPTCAQHGVGVIVRVPLDEGGLTGRITADTTFPDGDFRNSYFRGDRKALVEHRIDALTADLGIDRSQVAEVALRYVLGEQAVSTIIVGMRSVRNVERNAAVSDGRGLTGEQRAILAKHRWERNFYEA